MLRKHVGLFYQFLRRYLEWLCLCGWTSVFPLINSLTFDRTWWTELAYRFWMPPSYFRFFTSLFGPFFSRLWCCWSASTARVGKAATCNLLGRDLIESALECFLVSNFNVYIFHNHNKTKLSLQQLLKTDVSFCGWDVYFAVTSLGCLCAGCQQLLIPWV